MISLALAMASPFVTGVAPPTPEQLIAPEVIDAEDEAFDFMAYAVGRCYSRLDPGSRASFQAALSEQPAWLEHKARISFEDGRERALIEPLTRQQCERALAKVISDWRKHGA